MCSTIPPLPGAPILIAGDNCGCGSSREHAAWALADMGIEAVIAPGFSDIFAGNAFRNGIVAIVLPAAGGRAAARRGARACYQRGSGGDDRLLAQRRQVRLRDGRVPARLPDGGLDEIALSLSYEAAIRAYELRTGT